MRSLYYPASRPIARGKDFLLFLLSTAANMWDIVASLDLLVCWCPIIARVQTEMLRPLLGWLGTGNDDAIQGRAQPFHIVAVGSVDDHGQGNASPIRQETALGAFLAAIGRIGERERLFPEELLSLLHLQLATPTGFLPVPHTPVVPPATISGRSLSAPNRCPRSCTVELAPNSRGSAFHPDTSS